MECTLKDRISVPDKIEGEHIDSDHKSNTVIIHEVLPNGKKIFREMGKNKVIISGSEFHARKDFNFGTGSPLYITGYKTTDKFYPEIPNMTTYDVALAAKGLEPAIPDGLTPCTDGDCSYEEARKIYLFAVGIDGCGLENSRRFTVKKNDWIAPYGPAPDGLTPEGDQTVTTCLIPFRYVDKETPFSPSAVVTGGYGGSYYDNTANKTLYFFKEFDNAPELTVAFGDVPVSEIGESVWKYQSAEALECVVKLTLSVTKDEVKEWFAACGQSDTAKINTISLISAVPYKDASGNIWYKDFRPVTKYNMTNKPLSDPGSGLEITYLLYY